MEIESIETIYNKYIEDQNPPTLSSIHSEDNDETIHQKQLKVCQINPIHRLLKTQTLYMIIGDTYIDLDPCGDVKFIETIRVLNSYRPVQKIKRDLEKKFIRIQIDLSAQGVKDFRFLIHMMQSMQNQEMYALSKSLEDYQLIVDEGIQNKQSNKSDSINKKNIFKKQEQMIEQILKQEAINNPFAIQLYEVYNCIHGSIDVRKSEFGYNENYVYLIGTDPETIQTFTIREGWFNSSSLINSNSLERRYLEKYLKEFFETRKVSGYFEPFDHVLYTIDQILIPIKVSPVCYYLYDDMTLSTELKFESIDNIISGICIFNIDIEASNIKKLMNIRKSKNTLTKNNLLLSSLEHTLSLFSYEIQADYFYNKYYNVSHKLLPKEPQLNELFPEKTCKYRCI